MVHDQKICLQMLQQCFRRKTLTLILNNPSIYNPQKDNVMHEVQRWCPDVQLQVEGVETERGGIDKDLPVDIQVELGTGAVERGAESNGSRACGRRGMMRMRIPSLSPRLLHQLRGCSCCCLIPILVFLTMVSAWSSMLQTQYVTPTGELVSTAGNPALHLDCMPEGTYNHSKPTVLFLHGLAVDVCSLLYGHHAVQI